VLSPQELDRLEVLGTKVVQIEGKYLEEAMRDLITKDPAYANLPYGGNPGNRDRPSGKYEGPKISAIRSLFRKYVAAAKDMFVNEDTPMSRALKEELLRVEQIRKDNAVIRDKGQLDLLREAGSSTQTFVDALN
jgi:hypothetical protein